MSKEKRMDDLARDALFKKDPEAAKTVLVNLFAAAAMVSSDEDNFGMFCLGATWAIQMVTDFIELFKLKPEALEYSRFFKGMLPPGPWIETAISVVYKAWQREIRRAVELTVDHPESARTRRKLIEQVEKIKKTRDK